MILDPSVMALLLSATLVMLALAAAAPFALRLLRHWNPASGHAAQLRMEKRTHLVSTVMRLVLLLQLLSLPFFVHNADRMSVLFTGAMCALGTLNVNIYGIPAFLLQMAVFFGAGLWLVVNAADNAGRDYPFTRLKYAILLALTPVALAAGVMQWLHFLGLDPNVITSCCSQLFTPRGAGPRAGLSSLEPGLALALMFGGLALLAPLGLAALRHRRLAVLHGVASALFLVVAITAIIAAVAPYIYEAPTHHCPFCILKPQYDHIGYFLYAPLFGATLLALGVGVLSARPAPPSMRCALPRLIRRLVLFSLALFLLFGAVSAHAILSSHLRLLAG